MYGVLVVVCVIVVVARVVVIDAATTAAAVVATATTTAIEVHLRTVSEAIILSCCYHISTVGCWP